MSTTVDERVVEMRFDNQNFERNVQTSMSTLDKLKQSLNLTGASKGLETINAAAKNNNMSVLAGAVETVHAKFSALEVMGVTALANITNSAVNAGKRMLSALTIDPVKTGLSEYETKMNAIQVIQANTRGKNDMNDITAALDDLNAYADKTIYNFAQMTSNIGKFTAQGFDVQSATNAVKGLANLAAASGASAEDMARATYQMSQAMGSSIKLMDWNSLRNANMATQDLKDTLIALAKTHGIAIDDMIEKEGTFEYTLQNGWLTGEMFTEAMNIYSGVYSDAELKAKGFTDSQITNFKDLAATAESAATEVKTFTQLWDVLKETAQSGWTQTWELLIGDFDSAKSTLTELQVYLSDIINGWSNARNFLLEGAMNFSAPWKRITEKLDAAGLSKITDMVDNVSEAVEKIEHLVVSGDTLWGIAEKYLGDGRRYTELAELNNIENPDLIYPGDKIKISMDGATESVKETTSAFTKLSDEQLRNAGLTEDEIKLYRDLEAEAERTGVSVSELAEEMSKNDGRTLMIESLKNAGSGLIGIFTALKNAWVEIFPPMSVVRLYSIIKAVNEFSENLRLTDKETGELTDTAKKLQRTFKGVFALIDIIATIAGGAFKIAFKAITALLGYFNLDILDVTASIGDAIVGFRDWIDSVLDFTAIFEKVIPVIKDVIGSIGDWIEGIKEADNIPQYIISGLINGLKSGASAVIDAIIALGKNILQGIKDVLGIHSPSTEFFEIGENIIQGLINGLKNGAIWVWNTIKSIGTKCIDIIKNIDIGKIFAAGIAVSMLVMAKKLIDIVGQFAAPFEGLGSMFEGLGDMFEGLGSKFKAEAWEARSNALLNLAKAIAILALSVYLIASINPSDLLKSVIVIGLLATIIGVLTLVVNKLNSGNLKTAFNSAGILGIAGALLILVGAMKIIGTIDIEDVPKILLLLTGMILSMATLVNTFSLLTMGGEDGKSIAKASKIFKQIAIAMLIMVGVVKLASMLDPESVAKGLLVVGLLEVLFIGIIAVSKLAGEHADKAGSMMFKMSMALLLMIGVIKLASNLDWEEAVKGLLVVGLLEILFMGIIAVSKLAGEHADKAGSMMLKMSMAMLIMVGVIRAIGSLDGDVIKKGIGAIAAIELLFAGIIAISKLAGDNVSKAGTMMVKMSVALLIISGAMVLLTGIIYIFSKMDPSGLGRGLAAVTLLGVIFGVLIGVTKLAETAKDSKSSLIPLIVGIALLATAIVALSLLDPNDLRNATTALTAVMVAFSLLIASTKLAKNTKQMRKSLDAMLGVVIGLAVVLGVMAKLNAEGSLENAAAISLLMISFAGALAIMGAAGRISATVSKQMWPMLGIVTGLALILGVMSKLDANGSIQSAIAISILMEAFAGALVIMSKAGRMSTTVSKTMLPMLGVVAGLALILGLMAKLEVTASIQSAISLSILLNAMTIALTILSGAVFVNVGNTLIALAGMTLVVAGLAVILGLMAKFDVAPSIETAASLSLLLLSMSGALAILAVVGAFGPAAFIGIGALATLIVGIGGLMIAIGALATYFPQLEEFLDTGIPILEKIGHGIGSFVGNILGGFLGGIGSGLSDMAQDLSDFAEKLQPFLTAVSTIKEDSVEGVKHIADMITSLCGANLLETITGWLGGGSSLETFGSQLVPFGKAMVAFSSEVSGNIDENAVTAAANAGKMMAEMQATIPGTGGVIQWFAGEKDMSLFGTQLESFGKSIVSFSNTVKGNIDETAVAAAANAGKLMAEMQATIPGTGGVVQWFTGEKDMSLFGTQLESFGKSIVTFSNTVKGNIDETAVAAAANAGVLMAEMQKTIPGTGGVVQWFTGDKDMALFGTQLVSFGSSIVTFSETVKGRICEEAIVAAANAGKLMAEMNTAVPSIGGVVSWFTGDNDLATFGENIAAFGEALTDFSENTVINDTAVASATNAGLMMSALQDAIPSDTWFDGKVSLDDFGKKIKGFGEHLVSYSDEISEIDMDKLSSSISEANRFVQIASLLVSWDTSGIEKFNVKAIGTAMKDYYTEVSGIDADVISSSITSADRLKTLVNNLVGLDNSGIPLFKVKSIGDSIKAYHDSVAGIDTSVVSSSILLANRLKNLIAGLAGIDVSGVGAFKSAIDTLGEVNIDQVVKAFDGASEKFSNVGANLIKYIINGVDNNSNSLITKVRTIISDMLDNIKNLSPKFKPIGATLTQNLASGVAGESDKVTTATKTVIASALLNITNYYDSFYSAGSYLVDGFKTGISDNAYKAAAKAEEMAKAAKAAAEKALGINSPSKVFYEIGNYTGLGFINALRDYRTKSYEAGSDMADSARSGLSDAINKIGSLIDGDMDLQPTISPVLDLNNVKTGINAIDEIFNRGASFGISGDIGAISSAMNQRNQNGGFDDVVSAIDDLRKNLESLKAGNTYNIDGVTYKGDDDIADAVSALVRAARIERRA